MADPLSFQLPRKYKIAFAACGRDCPGATVNDLGFIARRQNGTEGFAVYVAGGMGGKSRVATLLHEFIPASGAFLVAEAVKRVFDKSGDRKNKHLARLRFVVERIGFDAFRDLHERELAVLRASAPTPLQTRPSPRRDGAIPKPTATGTASWPAEFARWFASNVTPQKQLGLFMVHIPLALGDLTAAKALALADIVAAHGDGILRATQSQNLGLRWVAESELPAMRENLNALGLATPEAPVLRNLVACAGASTCRPGICLSRGLAKAIRQELTNSQLKLQNLGSLTVHISGCPNSCGRHPVGNIGLSGAARRIDGQLVPYYAVQLGGRVSEGQTRFGTNVGAVPARNAPAFVREILAAWQQSSESSDFHRFVDTSGKAIASELIRHHQRAPTSEQNKEFCLDWDSTEGFSLAGRGAGECSAGVFDLIEVDLANARESLEAGRFYFATVSAARALLVTRRLQPRDDLAALELFREHFVMEKLVDASFAEVINAAMGAAVQATPDAAFNAKEADVTALVASVRLLYESLDASLHFKPAQAAGSKTCHPSTPP